MNRAAVSPKEEQAKSAPRREWAPRMWEGCNLYAWLGLLVRNRFAVHWSYSYIAVIVTFVSFCHTIGRWIQALLYGKRIKAVKMDQAPIFIIGHWRTGTTLLHEFLILDPRHSYPNYYECLEPNHFLLTEGFFRRYMTFLMPTHRPMDNMAVGWERPQEDEFALCMLGLPSPYLSVAFPNRPPAFDEYLDLKNISAPALARWKRVFLQFLKTLTWKDPRRLVLKSPPHSCRASVLLELFPDARFVHIVRDPVVVFPSTVNMWRALHKRHGLQKPTCPWLEDHVLKTFPRIYQGVEETRRLAAPNRFHEVRYEDLVANPVSEMRRLYDQLELGEFDAYLPRLEEYLATIKGYETNRYEITPEQRALVRQHWGSVMKQFGYDHAGSNP